MACRGRLGRGRRGRAEKRGLGESREEKIRAVVRVLEKVHSF
jgi:hypothetical protein